jgi:DnaJ family protein C protein 9
MNDSDPLLTFFTSKEASNPHLLYSVLSVQPTATPDEIKKGYRKAALRLHPDKNSGKSEDEKVTLGKEFQKVGFAWAVLSDEGKKKR